MPLMSMRVPVVCVSTDQRHQPAIEAPLSARSRRHVSVRRLSLRWVFAGELALPDTTVTRARRHSGPNLGVGTKPTANPRKFVGAPPGSLKWPSDWDSQSGSRLRVASCVRVGQSRVEFDGTGLKSVRLVTLALRLSLVHLRYSFAL